MQGPAVRRLICEKMATDAVPSGGGLSDALGFLSSKEKIAAGARQATVWVEAAIAAVRTAREPNPWKDASDDAIAEEILKQIKAKRAKAKSE